MAKPITGECMKIKIKQTDWEITYTVSANRVKKGFEFLLWEIDEHIHDIYTMDVINKKDIGKMFAIARKSPEDPNRQDELLITSNPINIKDGWGGNSDHTIRRHYG